MIDAISQFKSYEVGDEAEHKRCLISPWPPLLSLHNMKSPYSELIFPMKTVQFILCN